MQTERTSGFNHLKHSELNYYLINSTRDFCNFPLLLFIPEKDYSRRGISFSFCCEQSFTSLDYQNNLSQEIVPSE